MLSRKLSNIVVIGVGLASFACGTAQANLVTNGDFASYSGSPPKNFFAYVLPTDWNSSGYIFVDAPGTADNPSDPGIPVWPAFPNSPIGGNFIQADGANLAAPLTQTISGLIAGQNYNLSFYQAAGQQLNDYGNTTEQWEVSLGSQTQYSTLMNNPSAGVTPWMTQSMTFSATGPSEVLSFIALGSGGVPPQVFLDGVDLESTVPEPSALMLIAGVGAVCGLGRMCRRLRSKPTAA